MKNFNFNGKMDVNVSIFKHVLYLSRHLRDVYLSISLIIILFYRFCFTEYKRSRQEIKKKSSDTLKLQKKARKGLWNSFPPFHHETSPSTSLCYMRHILDPLLSE